MLQRLPYQFPRTAYYPGKLAVAESGIHVVGFHDGFLLFTLDFDRIPETIGVVATDAQYGFLRAEIAVYSGSQRQPAVFDTDPVRVVG